MRVESAPLLPLVVAFAAGIVAASWLTPSPVALLELSGGFLVVAAVAIGFRFDRSATLLLVAVVVTLGALRGVSSLLPPDHIAHQALPPVVTIEGRLAQEPVRWAPDRTRLLLDVDAYHEGADRRPATGRVQLTIYGEAAPLGEGQRIRAEVRLHRPIGFRNPGVFDYPEHLRRQGILLVGSGRADRVIPLTADAPPWPVKVRRWAVATLHAQLPESSAALLAGLLLGERTALPSETDEAFRRAGVYHVLAVSGFNVALLASSVFASLALLGVARRPTALVAVIVLVGFALVVGGQPSVLRATVMGLLLLGGILIERESQVMNALCLAGLVLLAWTPTDLWDPGFQLSFAATAGIVYLAGPFMEFLGQLGWPHWLAAAVAVSLAAQLPVTPVMLAHFNQLSLIGVAANLLVVPLAGPATTLGLLAVALGLSVWPWVSPGDGRLRITFLDVGQGDATFVELPEGRRILVDGGPGGARRFDVGERVLAPFLWNRPLAGRLDVVALTHSDSDHAGGLGAILRHFSVGEFWETGRWGLGSEDTLAALQRSGTMRRVLTAGQRLWIGSALFTVINPDSVPNPSVNDDSLVLRLDWRGVSLLLPGDLGGPGEARVLEREAPVRVLLLKVAHHGSRSSSSAAFVEAARPAFAIISVGARNPFRHPTPEALARLEAVGARIYRTDRDGALIIETDGTRLWLTRWASRTTEVFDLAPAGG